MIPSFFKTQLVSSFLKTSLVLSFFKPAGGFEFLKTAVLSDVTGCGQSYKREEIQAHLTETLERHFHLTKKEKARILWQSAKVKSTNF